MGIGGVAGSQLGNDGAQAWGEVLKSNNVIETMDLSCASVVVIFYIEEGISMVESACLNNYQRHGW